MAKAIVFVLTLLCLQVTRAATSDLDQRTTQLARELRCVVCQNQNLADSQATLAQDLKQQIWQQLQQGRSEQEVRDWMTQRYGNFVLYKPPSKPKALQLLMDVGGAWGKGRVKREAVEGLLELDRIAVSERITPRRSYC